MPTATQPGWYRPENTHPDPNVVKKSFLLTPPKGLTVTTSFRCLLSAAKVRQHAAHFHCPDDDQGAPHTQHNTTQHNTTQHNTTQRACAHIPIALHTHCPTYPHRQPLLFLSAVFLSRTSCFLQMAQCARPHGVLAVHATYTSTLPTLYTGVPGQADPRRTCGYP